MIEREELQSLVPHKGSMCLLDAVVQWDDVKIVCQSNTHLKRDNPLRGEAGLDAVHALEYGAQALAVHGGLHAREEGRVNPPGYLAALRNAQLGVERLDTLVRSLTVTAHRMYTTEDHMIYEFEVSAGDQFIASARAVVTTNMGQE